MTASAVTSVSLEPPMLLFCVHTDARFRDALDDVDTWSVSVLADDQAPHRRLVRVPGAARRSTSSRASRTARHRSSDAVWVDGAAAWFDCRTAAVHRAGDHDVVVGSVLAAEQGAAGAGGLVHLRGRLRPVR